MPYIGRSANFGVRTVFHYLASNGDTSVSGADADGKTLTFADGNYIDVYLNGVRLKSGEDYNTNTANTVAGMSSLNANDEVNVIVYDAFSIADVLPLTGGNLTGDLGLQSDSSVLSFGADSDVTITHDPDDGLFLKSTATGDDNPFVLTLQTGETDIAADDVLGQIDFQAPDEGTGTDAILVAAGISAISEGDFSSSSNATSLVFKTGASEAAAEKVRIKSDGALVTKPAAGGHAVFNEDSVDADFRVEGNGNTHMLFVDGGVDAVGIGTSTVDANATMTVSNTGDNHGISIVGALNKSRMHFQGANTGSASTDGLVIGLSSSDDTNDDSALFALKESGKMTFQTAGTNHMIIDGTGAVTKPLQPGFLVRNSSDQSNISLATLTTIVFDTEVFDTNADFASNTFTAPVTGRYLFTYNINFAQVDADHTVFALTLATSNNTFTNNPIITPTSFDADMSELALGAAIICDMDANDTALVKVAIEGGSAQTDIKANGVRTNFGGYLLG